MGRRITSGHWFSRHIIAVSWRYVLLSWMAALVMVSASPTLIAHGNYDQASGSSKAMFPQESGSAPVAAPLEGPAGSLFTVSGSGFRSFAVVESIKLGGLGVLGNRTVNTDADGNFIAASLLVPGLDPGIHALVVTVGSGSQETNAVGTFEVTVLQQDTSSGSPEVGLAPLLDADNLERVFNFRNSTKDWIFYDPRPAFAAANTLKELRNREIYWLKVRRDQDVTLNGKAQRVSCANKGTASENCWNLVVW